MALALIAAPALGFATSALIGAVWSTCGGVGDTAGFSVVFGLPLIAVPVISIMTFTAMMVVALITRRSRPIVTLAVASVLALVVAGVSFGYAVPYPGAADFYASLSPGVSEHCQTSGMPNWWPDWLPN